jgi:hypothetical protein
MFTRKIFLGLMTIAMMIISNNIAEAQRISHDTLQIIGQPGDAGAAVMARAQERGAAIDQDERAQEASKSELRDHREQQKKAIVGSWLDTVTITGGPTFKSLSTFTGSGSVLLSTQVDVITEPPISRVLSPGHGVWVYEGRHTFSRTHLQLFNDLRGNLVGIIKVQATITLDQSGDAYSAVLKARLTDPAGNVIGSSEGTIEGQRIKAEPLP